MITLNGEPLHFSGSVADLVEHRFHDRCRRGIAVAVNREMVPRTAWDTTIIAPGDRIELVTAVQGG